MTLRRIRLFFRDWSQEWGIAWEIARMRDCDRNGGHQWLSPRRDPDLGLSRECRRCHVSESIAETSGTAATNVRATYGTGRP